VENPDRIKAARQAFKVGDTVSFFDETENTLRSVVVMEKNIKYVSLINKTERRLWKVPYCFLNLGNVSTDIYCERQEKLTKNHLKIGIVGSLTLWIICYFHFIFINWTS